MYKLILLALLMLSGKVAADTQQEIDHLLDFVANTTCQYDRNGTIHTGQEARNHINRKYEYYKKKVKTAEDFIKYSATKSTFSGRRYKIRCPDAEVINASDWLLDELQAFRDSKVKVKQSDFMPT
jgi:hypothetical protein